MVNTVLNHITVLSLLNHNMVATVPEQYDSGYLIHLFNQKFLSRSLDPSALSTLQCQMEKLAGVDISHHLDTFKAALASIWGGGQRRSWRGTFGNASQHPKKEKNIQNFNDPIRKVHLYLQRSFAGLRTYW
jgi:hypothetical protein